MKVMLKRMANEQEAQKNADRQAAEKKTKLVDDMSLMKQSELWKMVVGDRVRSLLKYESSRKGKDKGKDKGKKEAKRSTLGSCTVCTKTTTDPCLKIRLNTWCCNRKNQITSRTWGKIMHAGKGKKSGQEKSKTQPQTSKGKIKGKSSGKGQACEEHTKPSQETGKGKGNSKRGFTGGESSEDWTSARWDSHTNARDTYVVSSTLRLELECPVCTDVTNGIALKKQLIFWLPTSRSVCNLNSRQAPCVPGPSFGWIERTMPNTVSEAENFQIWAVLPKPVATLRMSSDGG